MRLSIGLSFVFSTALAASAPSALQERGAPDCDPYVTYHSGRIDVIGNGWGHDKGVGHQCTDFYSGKGNTVSWSTRWSWQENKFQVKGYPSAKVNPTPRPLSTWKTIPTHWSYSYTGTKDVKANVAYDLFITDVPGGPNKFEIMVWLGAYGAAGPLKNDYKPNAPPLARLTIGGKKYDLWSGGADRGMTTYSFVASDAYRTEGHFTGDLMEFVTYLIKYQGLSSRHYLQSISAGTETFLGTDCTFTTHSYSISA